MFEFDFKVIWNNAGYILKGLPITFCVSIVSIGIGLVLGLIIGALRLSKNRFVTIIPELIVEMFRNTPVFIQIVWFHYAVPIMVGIKFTPLQSGIIALGLNAAAYLSEIFRGGILAIDIGQSEAAIALGFNYLQTMRRIILPQGVRKMLPSFVNTFILMIKQSALVAYIGVAELFYKGNTITVATYKPIEIYSFVAIIYFTICYIGSKFMALLEVRLAIHERRS